MCENQVKSNVDFSNYCRVCAKEKRSLLSLFRTRKSGILLAEMISQCTQLLIDPNDDRPSGICSKCTRKVKASFKFRNLAKESEKKFQQMHPDSVEMKSEEVLDIKVEEHSEEENGDYTDYSKSSMQPIVLIEPLQLVVENQPNDEFEDEFLGENDSESSILLTPSLTPSPSPSSTSENQSSETSEKLTENPKRPNGKHTNGLTHERQIAKKWECHKCKLRLERLKTLQAHIKEHNDATPNECTVCNMFFSNSTFNRHLCKGESIECEYCNEQCSSIVDLLKHLERHEKQIIVNKCPRCPRLFSMKKLAEWHLNHGHEIRLGFSCDICDKQFSKFSFLTAHKKTHTNKRSKTIFMSVFGCF